MSFMFYGSNLPAHCMVGDIFANTTTSVISMCTSVNNWVAMMAGGPNLPPFHVAPDPFWTRAMMIKATVVLAAAVFAFITARKFILNWHARTVKATRVEATETARRLTATQIAQLSANQAAFYQLNEDRNNVMLFMREAYKKEIELGLHQGRTYDEIVIYYLKQERRLANMIPVYGPNPNATSDNPLPGVFIRWDSK